jgi:hypothetical protein
MKPGELLIGVLDRNEQYLVGALDGLTLEEVHRQVVADANTVGWLVWHLSRVQDRIVAAMEGNPQLWVTEGWHAKFGRPPDPDDRGVGHTPQEVAAFRVPDVGTLLAYYWVTRARTNAFLRALTASDLERQVPAVRGTEKVALAVRLNGLLVEVLQHTGQVAYIRGLVRGQGWLGPGGDLRRS